MEVKLTIIVLAVMTLMVNLVAADFFYNHPLPKAEEIANDPRYNCVPGRTIIRITDNSDAMQVNIDSDSEEFRRHGPSRKHHMAMSTDDESCSVCVCSAEGKDEYCSNRPARTVNECIMLKDITEQYEMGLPYDHTRNLYNRIRRDYIWHNDEIPYHPSAKCFRGHSYYTNSLTANDTDIDLATDIESLLDYDTNMTCFFCICHTSGEQISCLNRDISFCEYYKFIRSDENQAKNFAGYVHDDRPKYFRQLSYRLRRTMDNGLYDMIDAVSNNERPKRCVPFVSEYSNCNRENICSGCEECTCNGDGEWSCQQINHCFGDDTVKDDNSQEYNVIFDNALDMLDYEMNGRPPKIKASGNTYVPALHPIKKQNDLIDPFREKNLNDFLASLARPRRSITKINNKHSKGSVVKPSYKTTNSSHNNTVKLYDEINELNDDTLKNSNLTGTLVAHKMDVQVPLSGSRRSDLADNSSKALQIEFNQPKAYKQITDNKIEATEPENPFDSNHESLKTVFGNFSQNTRNNDLSKIVVNELKAGSEVIGDAGAVSVSNITFTSENDTLNAMAFIAGNLLNKLWNMEKDAAGASSSETDILKHETISDLLELFKEPLNMRQEMFLKNALEQLSRAVDQNKDVKNISICDTIQTSDKLLHNTSTNKVQSKPVVPCRKKSDTKPEKKSEDMDVKLKYAKLEMDEMNKSKATLKAIAKINNVIDLMKKFEHIQGNISELKHGPKLVFNHSVLNSKKHEINTELSKDEKNSLNTFGSLLEKITNLMLPKRNNKEIANAITSQNFLKNNDNLKKKFKDLYNIDLRNMTVSAKDKIILDYLTHFNENPHCLLNKKNDDVEAIPRVEGNILLNLSELFKLNSLGALVKLLEPKKILRSPNETEKPIVQTTTKSITKKDMSSITKGFDSDKFKSTKEKLKVHLKTIMEDLTELQSAKGENIKGNIKLEDALPCIYNILKLGSKEIVKKEENINPFEKITDTFQVIKKELIAAPPRRTIGDIMTVRPKSAIVWERLLLNLNDKSQSNTRRSSHKKESISYNKIKASMERIENGSSTYKHHVLLNGVPAAGKLVLLKALQQDVHATIQVIDDIKLFLENIVKQPDSADKIAELDEFVENMITRIKLNEKVNEKVNEKLKPSPREIFVGKINLSNRMPNNKLKKKPILRSNNPHSERSQQSDQIKISRTQIVNQLIRNRMELFIKRKEASGSNVKQDLNYSIAQKVLYYLDTGDYKLANELFRWIVSQTQNEPAIEKYVVSSTPKYNIEEPMRRMAYLRTSPELLEDPTKSKAMDWVTQDHLIKQLLNIKNMGL